LKVVVFLCYFYRFWGWFRRKRNCAFAYCFCYLLLIVSLASHSLFYFACRQFLNKFAIFPTKVFVLLQAHLGYVAPYDSRSGYLLAGAGIGKHKLVPFIGYVGHIKLLEYPKICFGLPVVYVRGDARFTLV
jgi:hypothetical protein